MNDYLITYFLLTASVFIFMLIGAETLVEEFYYDIDNKLIRVILFLITPFLWPLLLVATLLFGLANLMRVLWRD